MRARPSASRWIVVVVVTVVVLCFVGASMYAEHRTWAIHDAAASISRNSSPSIEHLAAARADLRDLQHDALQAALSPEPGDSLEGMLDGLGAMKRELGLYRRIPMFPGESELSARIEMDAVRVESLVSVLARAVRGNDLDAARRATEALDDAVESQAGDLMRSIELNASHAQRSALTIEQTRRQGTWTVLLLDGIAALLASILAYLGLKLIGDRERMLEERSEELEMFAGRVAHDLLNPLGAAELSIATAERAAAVSKDAPERLSTSLARALSSMVRAHQLIHALLEFARAGARPLDAAPAELRQTLTGVLDEAGGTAAQAGVELTAGPLADVRVRCAAGVLASIAGNLVRNAIKYVRNAPRRVRISSTVAAHTVRVEVEDSGPGVPAELRAKIFQPFMRAPGTAAKPGVGLGLATVRRLVERHGGRVGVQQGAGDACVFWFELPVVTTSAST